MHAPPSPTPPLSLHFNVGRLLACALAAALACLMLAPAAEALDVIVLQDGRQVEGTLVREDEKAVFLKVEGGEERGIAKSRIAEIRRDGTARPAGATAPVADPSRVRVPVPANPPPEIGAGLKKGGDLAPAAPDPGQLQGEMQELFSEIKEIGHSNREQRKAAIEKAVKLGFRAMPVLLALFHPQQRAAPELRIGSLRALAQLGPLDDQGARTLGFAAMKDPEPEVRREACQTIRALKEDRALNYILGFALKEDKAVQFAAARALREIDDDRAFAFLARAIPPPAVNANPDTGNASVREVMLPVGPYGSMMPVYLPTSDVSGTVSNYDGPELQALKIIAGKDLGNFQGVWVNWLREKAGNFTQLEREDAYKKRSVKDRMGSPHVQSGP